MNWIWFLIPITLNQWWILNKNEMGFDVFVQWVLQLYSLELNYSHTAGQRRNPQHVMYSKVMSNDLINVLIQNELIAWADVSLLSDLNISASKASPVIFAFQLLQFSPLQHTFVFLFPFLPITLNFTQVRAFIFPLSCFIVQWIACSPFQAPFRYHVCLLFTLCLSISDPFSLTVFFVGVLTVMPPTATGARTFCPSVKPCQFNCDFTLPLLSWPIHYCCTLSLSGSAEKPATTLGFHFKECPKNKGHHGTVVTINYKLGHKKKKSLHLWYKQVQGDIKRDQEPSSSADQWLLLNATISTLIFLQRQWICSWSLAGNIQPVHHLSLGS